MKRLSSPCLDHQLLKVPKCNTTRGICEQMPPQPRERVATHSNLIGDLAVGVSS